MGYIDIKRLSLDELVGVVSLYPWFGGARRELCERMKGMGDDVWGESQFAEAAMYIPSREKMSVLMRSFRTSDMTDADVEDLIKSHSVVEKKVHVVGGDYFSQAEYDSVRKSDDKVFSRYAAKARQDKSYAEIKEAEFDLCTETLAQIYLEQGYPEQAKNIYSKLLLANPEKNAYFASLIEKIDEINKL